MGIPPALLGALHPERERAAERYEEIRERLRIFFVWRGARWPEEMTDETIDRVGRRLLDGEVIRASDVGRYFLGVARNVLRESWQLDGASRAAYRASLQTPEGRELWARDGLYPVAAGGRSTVPFTVPAAALAPGHYVVTLGPAGHRDEPDAEYVFRVRRP